MDGLRGTRGGENKCLQRFGENKTGNEHMNITYRSTRITPVAIRSNKCYIFWLCVCSLSYPKRTANAPYYSAICD
jgi:hypothetical protein